jgi:hypothetical protein
MPRWSSFEKGKVWNYGINAQAGEAKIVVQLSTAGRQNSDITP